MKLKKVKKFGKGGQNKPIITNDPKDLRLQAYNDSLDLYNFYQLQKDLDRPSDVNNNLSFTEKIFGTDKKFTLEGEKRQAELFNKAQDLLTRNNRLKTGLDSFPKAGIGDYRKSGSYDVYSPSIKPKGEWMGTGKNSEYIQPVQPIIYQPKPINIPINTPSYSNGQLMGVWNEELKQRPKEQPIQIDNITPTLNTYQPDNTIETNPFIKGSYFTRPRQSQESQNDQFGRTGKTDMFDKKTGKLMGTYADGGGVNRYDVPAQSPTGQSYFQLPYNELATALLSKQKQQDDVIQKADSLRSLADTIKALPENVTGPGQDETTAKSIINDINTSIDDLSTKNLTSPEGKQELNKVVGRIRNYFGPQGPVTALNNRYNQYYNYLKNYEETYKNDPLIRNYAGKQIQLEPFQTNKGYGKVGEGNLYKNVELKDMNEYYNKILDNTIASTLQQYDPVKFANANDAVAWWKSGKATGLLKENVLEALGKATPAEFMQSMGQRRAAVGDPNSQEEYSPVKYIEQEVKDKNGKVLGKKKVLQANPNSYLGNMLDAYAQNKAHVLYDNQYFHIEDPTSLEKLKNKVGAVPVTNTSVDITPVFDEDALGKFDITNKGTTLYEEGAGRPNIDYVPKTTNKDQYLLNINKLPERQKNIVVNLLENQNPDLAKRVKNGQDLTQEEKAKYYPELKKRLELWSKPFTENVRTIGLTPDEGKTLQYGLFGHNKPEFMKVENLGTGTISNLKVYDKEKNQFLTIQQFKKKFDKDDQVVVNEKVSGDNLIDYMSGGTGQLEAAYKMTVAGQDFYIPAPEQFIDPESGSSAIPQNIELNTTRYINRVHKAGLEGKSKVYDFTDKEGNKHNLTAIFDNGEYKLSLDNNVLKDENNQEIKSTSSSDLGKYAMSLLIENAKSKKSK